MIDLFASLTLTDTHEDMVRNIVSIRVSQDLFDDLSDSKEAWEAAIALENEVKPPMFQSVFPVIHRPFEEAEWDSAVEYPFRKWSNSRFSDGTYGVWYGAKDLDTTIFETVHHWRAGILADSGLGFDGLITERKVYNVRCDALLLDFRGMVQRIPSLIDPFDRTLTHQIGNRMHKEGHPGLLSRSARCDGDTCAIFNRNVLSNPRELCRLTYTMRQGSVCVEREPGVTLMVID